MYLDDQQGFFLKKPKMTRHFLFCFRHFFCAKKCFFFIRGNSKGTRAGWQVHLDSGPMPQGEENVFVIPPAIIFFSRYLKTTC